MSTNLDSTRLLTADSYRVMPWKNGGGTTSELMIEPEGSALTQGSAPFLWRLSLATLDGSGPFSSFAGYDRIILQTEGPPMRLNHADIGGHELTPLVPYRFAGEWVTEGVLSGPAKDLNVMTLRGRAAAHVETIRLSAGSTFERAVSGDWLIVHTLVGDIEATASRPRARTGDTLVASPRGALVHLTARSDATLVVVVVTIQSHHR